LQEKEIMEFLTLTSGLIAAVALLFAWRGARRAHYLEERLDTTNNRYFTVANQLRELEETSQSEIVDLKVELKRQAGLLKFEPQMTIGEISDMHPRAVEVLAGFHLGGCSSCAVSPDQTLSSAAQQHNINLDRLLGSLRQLADGQSGGSSHQLDEPAGALPPPHSRLTTDPDLRIIA
jgi:hybrid cluster-associated redox disulfide protein